MTSRTYLFVGGTEEGTAEALAFAKRELGAIAGNPDVVVFSSGLFSVDDARRVSDFARGAPVRGNGKVLIIAAPRFFHEAQNALLKLFEEPPESTALILIVPSEGILLPTLRSRLFPLPHEQQESGRVGEQESRARQFLNAAPAAREKIVAKLLERTRSDDDEEKQAAREEARLLVGSLLRVLYKESLKADNRQLMTILSDLDRFMPILHERSAPLKLILEHVLLTVPTSLR